MVSIEDSHGNIVESVSLKLHAVCEGPRRHDHLLKEMKARIIYNLDISQVVASEFCCQNFGVSSLSNKNPDAEFGFLMELLVPE